MPCITLGTSSHPVWRIAVCSGSSSEILLNAVLVTYHSTLRSCHRCSVTAVVKILTACLKTLGGKDSPYVRQRRKRCDYSLVLHSFLLMNCVVLCLSQGKKIKCYC